MKFLYYLIKPIIWLCQFLLDKFIDKVATSLENREKQYVNIKGILFKRKPDDTIDDTPYCPKCKIVLFYCVRSYTMPGFYPHGTNPKEILSRFIKCTICTFRCSGSRDDVSKNVEEYNTAKIANAR